MNNGCQLNTKLFILSYSELSLSTFWCSEKVWTRGNKPAQSRTGRLIRMVIWRVLWVRQGQNSQKYSIMSHVGVCCYWPVKCRYLTPKLKKKIKSCFGQTYGCWGICLSLEHHSICQVHKVLVLGRW